MTTDHTTDITARAEGDDATGGAGVVDPTGTVRVHPDDDPHAPGARRYVRTAVVLGTRRRIDDAIPWTLLTGWGMLHAPDGYVDDWPVQPWPQLAAVFDHPTDPPDVGHVLRADDTAEVRSHRKPER